MAEHDDDLGPVVSETWVTSRRAINAFDDFCLERRWVFTETPDQTDFGKDGYLDFSSEGRLTGQCIAVQIKGGISFAAAGGSYLIPATRRQRRFWLDATVPVFGIVWDPRDGALYWTELTRTLQLEGIDAPLRVPSAQQLGPDTLDTFLGAMWRATTASPIATSLGSDDPELQEVAIYDCYGLGRFDARYLILLRRVMFGLRPEPLDTAIYVLNSCSLNMDLALDPHWMKMDERATVRRTFVWTVDEAVRLLERVQDEDGFERGSFSSAIYWLIVGPEPYGEHFVELAEAAALRAAEEGRERAAKWALVLRVYWAGEDGPATFARLTSAQPSLAHSDVAIEVASNLRDHGHLTL